MKHIVLIDDDEALRYLLGKALTRLGFRITAVGEAVQALKLAHIDGALIDLKLGSESGLNLIAPLRARHEQAKLVMLTGYASITTAVEAMRRGADDYLVKPTDPATIAELFRSQSQPSAAIAPDSVAPEFTAPSIRRAQHSPHQMGTSTADIGRARRQYRTYCKNPRRGPLYGLSHAR